MSKTAVVYVEVVIPLGVEGLYTYALPPGWTKEAEDLTCWSGRRLLVPFGPKRHYTAVVWDLCSHQPEYAVREALEILDEEPVWGERGRSLWAWVVRYYLCSPGALLAAALPAMLRISSETVFVGQPAVEQEQMEAAASLSPLARGLWEHLVTGSGKNLDALERWLQPHAPWPLLQDLVSLGLVATQENLQRQYKPKRETTVEAGPALAQEGPGILRALDHAPLQQKWVLTWMALSPQGQAVPLSLLKERLGSDASQSSFKALTDKDILRKVQRVIPRVKYHEGQAQALVLTSEQVRAAAACRAAFQEGSGVLLFGVTGSGKTMVYLDLIIDVLRKGGQVLYLLPEIALTHQLVRRLAAYVGVQVGVYHSRYTDQERVELWESVRRGEIGLILAPRSGIFLPFRKLGLLVVDEEHDASYKQQDRPPFYHARDMALWLASENKIPIVLGSATPSPETWLACRLQRLHRVDLPARYGDRPMPRWEWVDMVHEKKAGRLQGEFSLTMLEAIKAELQAGNQVILFKNRRGYAPLLFCEDCNWTACCDQCDLSLTYHKSEHQLRCHGCGQIFASPPACMSCASTRLKYRGYGTQKVEEALELLLDGYRIGRLDQDAVRGKQTYGRTLEAFERGELQILVGTQMVSKGLDFPKVNLVGVLDADQGLNRTQFRAQERSYQLLAQLAGRSGRHSHSGKILLQTRMPHHPLFRWLEAGDYPAFLEQELHFRQDHHYPPYVRLFRLTLGHAAQSLLEEAARHLASRLVPWLGKRLLGPAPPVTPLLRGEYRLEFWIKAEKEPALQSRIREGLALELSAFRRHKRWSRLRISVEVDPE